MTLILLLCLAILATYRIARLITFDGICSGLRGRIEYFASSPMETRINKIYHGKFMRLYYFVSSNLLYFINCAFCVGVWIGAFWGLLICRKFAIDDPLLIILICAGIPGGQAALEEILSAYRRLE